jgi:hypothetical protein
MSAKFDLTPDGWLENEPRQVTTPPEDLEPGGDIDEELTVDGWIVQPIVAPTPGPPPPPPPPGGPSLDFSEASNSMYLPSR